MCELRVPYFISDRKMLMFILFWIIRPILYYSDGGSQIVAGCLRDFRNKPFPTKAKIEYYQNTLTVSI